MLETVNNICITMNADIDWLPESLLMAGSAYEKLNLNEAANNVYKQVSIFYKDSAWATESKKRMAALPPS